MKEENKITFEKGRRFGSQDGWVVHVVLHSTLVSVFCQEDQFSLTSTS